MKIRMSMMSRLLCAVCAAMMLSAALSVLSAQTVYADQGVTGSQDTQVAENEDVYNDPSSANEGVYYEDLQGAGTLLKDDTGTTYEISDANPERPLVFYKKAPKGASGKVVIPDEVTIDGIPYIVEAIEERAFYKNKKVTKVVMGPNIHRIWNEAFCGCSALKSVTMSENIDIIDDGAFKKCTKLKSITIPAKVWSIGPEVFKNCKKLKKITILTRKLKKAEIGLDAFKGIPAKAVIKCPAGKRSAYRKMLLKRGAKKTNKYK